MRAYKSNCYLLSEWCETYFNGLLQCCLIECRCNNKNKWIKSICEISKKRKTTKISTTKQNLNNRSLRNGKNINFIAFELIAALLFQQCGFADFKPIGFQAFRKAARCVRIILPILKHRFFSIHLDYILSIFSRGRFVRISMFSFLLNSICGETKNNVVYYDFCKCHRWRIFIKWEVTVEKIAFFFKWMLKSEFKANETH